MIPNGLDSESLRRLADTPSPRHGLVERLYDLTGLNRWFLRPGSPPYLQPEPTMLVSPSDSTVDAICPIVPDGEVPGKAVLGQSRSYPVSDLVGPGFDAELAGGWCMVLYLAPWNLHWTVAPMDGEVVERRYRPGKCWPIFLFKRGEVENERLGLTFQQDSRRLHLVFVGSFNVSGIVCPCEIGDPVSRGHLIGGFKLGSTILLLSPPGQAEPLVQPGEKLFPGKPIAKWLI